MTLELDESARALYTLPCVICGGLGLAPHVSPVFHQSCASCEDGLVTIRLTDRMVDAAYRVLMEETGDNHIGVTRRDVARALSNALAVGGQR